MHKGPSTRSNDLVGAIHDRMPFSMAIITRALMRRQDQIDKNRIPGQIGSAASTTRNDMGEADKRRSSTPLENFHG